jgi:hypothetical protein
MTVTVGVNSRSVVHRTSNGKTASFPDVCLTPAPPGQPVPIPYPNVAKSLYTAKGSVTVKADGNPVCLKDSNFFKSSGDEAGVNFGVKSKTVMGKAEFTSYSFDVKIEGKNVPRAFDFMLHNGKNTLPFPLLQVPIIALPALTSDTQDETRKWEIKDIQLEKGESSPHLPDSPQRKGGLDENCEKDKMAVPPKPCQVEINALESGIKDTPSKAGSVASAANGKDNTQKSDDISSIVQSDDLKDEKASDTQDSKFDADKALDFLNSSAGSISTGACARYVRLAIKAGGIDINPNPVPAKEYGPYLEKYGFTAIDGKTYNVENDPQKGDIAVIQTYTGREGVRGI